jgi:hypothetical protein
MQRLMTIPSLDSPMVESDASIQSTLTTAALIMAEEDAISSSSGEFAAVPCPLKIIWYCLMIELCVAADKKAWLLAQQDLYS